MNKLITLLTCLLSIIFMFCAVSNAQKIDNKVPNEKSTKVKKLKSIPYLEISFDKENIVKWCQYFKEENNPCPKNAQNTKVNVSVKNLKANQTLTYTYIISKGQIIGEGANVIWDFSDVRPGKYALKVIADGSKNIHLESETKNVSLEQCGNNCGIFDPPCLCPNLSVTSPTESVKAGETITVNANVIFGSQKSVTYNWHVSRVPAGENHFTNWINASENIIEGQGTPNIKVKTIPRMAGETVVATVEIGGVCLDCGHTASVSVYVEKP